MICTGENYSEACAVLSFSAIHTCRNLAYGWLGNVSSVRYVGSGEDINGDALNLYSGVEFTGNSTLILADSPNTKYEFRSIALSGNVPVTFYTLPDYRGFSFCVEQLHQDGNYTLVQDITVSFGITSEEVQSIQFGCNSNNVITDKHFAKQVVVEI